MIPNILSLFFEKIRVLPSEAVINIIEKESILQIPSFIEMLINLAYDPQLEKGVINEEADRLLIAMVNSQANVIMLKHLFEMQGPLQDEKIKTIRGNKIIKSLPQWKQSRYDYLIRRIMMNRNGIFSVIKTLVDLTSSNRTPELAFTIAKCICKPPSLTNQDEYYEKLSHQIIDLIKATKLSKITADKCKENEIHGEYLRFGQCVGLECVHLYARINRDWARLYLLEKLFTDDFLRILESDKTSDFDEPEIVVESECLIDCLHLHNSLLSTHQPSLYVQWWLRRFSQIYISISLSVVDNDNKYKKNAREILVRLIELSYNSNHDTNKFVRALCQLEKLEDGEEDLNDKLEIRLALDRTNLEIAVRIDTFGTISSSVDKEMMCVEEVIDILTRLPVSVKNDVVSSLCIWLLEQRLIITTTTNSSSNSNNSASFQPDLLMGLKIDEMEHSIKMRNVLLYLLSTKMESNCFTKTGDILKFAQIAIEQYKTMQTNLTTIEGVTKATIKENVEYALNMIKVVLENGELTDNDKQILNHLFPILTDLIANYPNDTCADLITDICTVIATMGLVNPLLEKKASILIEEIDEIIDPQLKEAFDAVEDREISYKAFGLSKLHSLLQQKNESALRHRVKIYNIFSHYLFHSDSFLYVRAIRGLALIVDQFTDKLLPVIARKINDSRSIFTVEQWLTFSEVYMQIIRNLGQLAPAYRYQILNSILPHLNDKEELIRTSAVTNLGELCCQLEYAFSGVMHEIVTRVCCLLETDNSSRVKVACSIMIRKLILGKMDDNSGPRPDIIRLSSVLSTIRDSLIRVSRNELDEIVLDHVSVANKALIESIRSVPFFADSTHIERKLRIGDSELSFNYRKFTL